MSASCSLMEMESKCMRPLFNFSITMWRSIFMWHVSYARETLVAAIYIMYLAESLSQYKKDGCSKEILKSWSR